MSINNIKLDPMTLRNLANSLDSMAKVVGEITTIKFGDYIVSLEKHDDQRDGASYYVTGISRDGGNYRNLDDPNYP